MYTSRKWLVVVGVLVCANMTHAVDFTVSALVTPAGGGAAAAQDIGTIAVTTGAGGSPPLSAVFTLDPTYAYLDDWYDFRWVSLAKSVVGDTWPWSNLPAIDPQPNVQLPNEDTQPYYWTDAEFAVEHTERVSSTFRDTKSGWAPGTVITFNTYLVLNDITAGGFPDQEFCVLTGFSWVFNQNGEAPDFDPPEITIGAAALPVAGGIADIATGIANAKPEAGGNGPFTSPPGANPANAEWKAIEDCELSNCCGNNVREGLEQCDGTDDAACPGHCLPDCTCEAIPIPTVSEWSLIIMTVLAMTAGTILISRRRRAAA